MPFLQNIFFWYSHLWEMPLIRIVKQIPVSFPIPPYPHHSCRALVLPTRLYFSNHRRGNMNHGYLVPLLLRCFCSRCSTPSLVCLGYNLTWLSGNGYSLSVLSFRQPQLSISGDWTEAFQENLKKKKEKSLTTFSSLHDHHFSGTLKSKDRLL